MVCIVLFLEGGNQLTLEKCLKKILGLVKSLVLGIQRLRHFDQAVTVVFGKIQNIPLVILR